MHSELKAEELGEVCQAAMATFWSLKLLAELLCVKEDGEYVPGSCHIYQNW